MGAMLGAVSLDTAANYAQIGDFLLAAAVAVVAGWAGITQLPRAFNHARTVRERDRFESERNEYKGEAERLRGTVSALSDTAEALNALRGELHELQHRIDSLEETQIESTRYIARLITHIRDGGTAHDIPDIPACLRDDVLEALRERSQQ